MMKKLKYTTQEIQIRILDIAIEFDDFCRANDINYFICAGTLLGGIRHKGFIPWDDDFDVALLRSDFEKFAKLWQDSDILKLVWRGGEDGHNKYGCPLKLSSTAENVEEIDDMKRGMKVPNNYGIFIDIFPVDRYPDTLIGNMTYNYLGKLYLIRNLAEFNYQYRSIRERIVFRLVKFIPTNLIEKIIKRCQLRFSKHEKDCFLGYGIDTPFDKMKLTEQDIFPLIEVSINDHHFFAPNNWQKYLRQKFGDYMTLPPIKQRVGHILNVYKSDDNSEEGE
jgi:lipopolysaccharide cholinephosphotransferase